MLMLWVKAFHIVFMTSWFAGLFYLPRIYVNIAMVEPESVAERERLIVMARKLLRFMTLLAVPAIALGLWLWQSWFRSAGGWLHAKLLLVACIIIYHVVCARYRWFNEIPVLLLTITVILAVVKPF